MSLNLENLKNNKDEILKAEIISLLTLWEKILPATGINKTCKSIATINWNTLLNSKDIAFKDINNNLKRFKIWKNFLENWRKWRNKNSTDDILQILYGIGESLNSGIDKGSPKEDVKVQPEDERWLANAFGSFKRKLIYVEKIESEINDIINEIENKVLNILNNTNISLEDLEEIRDKLKELFSGLLSDDRFPINDVSLWEQTYMPSSMFKALLSDYILTHSDFNKIPNRQNVKWRILGIQYDKFGINEKSLKLASIKWYREIAEKIDKEIKNLLEVEYPIGNEIYRDETGIYFIVGESVGVDLDNDFNLAKLNDNLIEIEQKILEIFKEKTDDEFYPTIFLTKASRGLMNLSTLLEKAKENFLKIEWKNNDNNLNYDEAIGICPICQIRLIYKKDKEKNNSPIICEICDSRIHHSQISSWINNINNETIWIDEIKDKNNRIAYLALKFELKEWLNGDLLNSLLVRKENFIDYKSIVIDLIKLIKSQLEADEVKKLNIEDREINNIEKFLELFDEKGIQEPYKKNKEALQENKNIYNVEEKFRYLAEKLLKEEKWLEHFNFFENKNKIHTNRKKSKFLTINNYDVNDGVKGHLYKIFIINFLILQLKNILLERSIGNKWENFILNNLSDKSTIEFDKRKIEWNKLNDEDIEFLSILLLQFLLRKNPSPARLKRIWESTQEFFENIHKNLDEILALPKWRKNRLVWEIDYIDKIKETGEELEGNGLLFWAQSNEDRSKIKVYLISSIEDFIEKFGSNELKKELDKEDKKTKLNKIKHILQKQNFSLNLRKYYENKNKGEGDVLIILNSDSLSHIHSYKPYSLITDISPINYQIIIPAEYLPEFIDNVLRKYNKEFKYVYGKLPIHIGIIVSDYKKPVYVNLKALRNIRRDINSDELWIEKDKEEFQRLQSQKMSNEVNEDESKNYYALYFNNPDRKDYQFFIKPDNNWKYWISTMDKFPLGSKIKMIPNTFDFEFMDTNTRRNDIYYESSDKGYKRAMKIKSNRPYEIEIYWDKFKKYKDLFKNNVNTAKMHKLVGLFYEELQDYDEKYKPLLASAIVNILELRKNQNFLEDIQIIFDLNRENDVQKELIEKLDKEKLKLFIDMFEFWHTALKEV